MEPTGTTWLSPPRRHLDGEQREMRDTHRDQRPLHGPTCGRRGLCTHQEQEQDYCFSTFLLNIIAFTTNTSDTIANSGNMLIR